MKNQSKKKFKVMKVNCKNVIFLLLIKIPGITVAKSVYCNFYKNQEEHKRIYSLTNFNWLSKIK